MKLAVLAPLRAPLAMLTATTCTDFVKQIPPMRPGRTPLLCCCSPGGSWVRTYRRFGEARRSPYDGVDLEARRWSGSPSRTRQDKVNCARRWTISRRPRQDLTAHEPTRQPLTRSEFPFQTSRLSEWRRRLHRGFHRLSRLELSGDTPQPTFRPRRLDIMALLRMTVACRPKHSHLQAFGRTRGPFGCDLSPRSSPELSRPGPRRQLHAARTNAEVRAEHVELEAIDGTRGHAEHSAGSLPGHRCRSAQHRRWSCRRSSLPMAVAGRSTSSSGAARAIQR